MQFLIYIAAFASLMLALWGDVSIINVIGISGLVIFTAIGLTAINN